MTIPVSRPQCFGTTGYYMALSHAPMAVIDARARYNRRDKDVHRFAIADVRGRLEITIPVSRPKVPTCAILTWQDMVISDHGAWWSTHLNTLRSAYGRAPFFDVLFELIEPFFSEAWVGRSIVEYDFAADAAIRATLGVTTRVSATNPLNINADILPLQPREAPVYPQIREKSLGFIPGLSVLDYIANQGGILPV